MISINICRLPHSEGLPLPAYETAGAAGMDLRAAIDEKTPLSIAPGARLLIPTGFAIELPENHEGQIRPRSGLAIKHGIGLANSIGTIDEDYRGELKIPLINHSDNIFEITRGMRIAQLVIAPIIRPALIEVQSLSTSKRGQGGFGSTGAG